MPNNASARREKEKKSKKVKEVKDKKRKSNAKTDTPPLSKEDTASADSGTLSLSSAGQDKATVARIMEKAVAMWHEEKAKPKAGKYHSLSLLKGGKNMP